MLISHGLDNWHRLKMQKPAIPKMSNVNPNNYLVMRHVPSRSLDRDGDDYSILKS